MVTVPAFLVRTQGYADQLIPRTHVNVNLRIMAGIVNIHSVSMSESNETFLKLRKVTYTAIIFYEGDR